LDPGKHDYEYKDNKDSINCLLVQPRFSEYSALNYIDVCKIMGAKYPSPPLGLMTVAAILPQNWHFKLIDCNVEPLLEEHLIWAELVATGGILSQQAEIQTIIQKAHKLGKKIVVGGPDPTCQPEKYQKADYLVIGEGENTIPAFIEDLSNGRESGIYRSEEFVCMQEAVIPRFDLIDFDDYIMMGLQFSRGCPYNCEFCNVIELFGRKPRLKSKEQVLQELQALYELGYRGHIFFVDDNFFGHRKDTTSLLRAMHDWLKERNFPFYFGAEISINFAKDERLLQLLKDVDFRYLSMGLETPEDELLESVNKVQNMNSSIKDTVKKILSYGMVPDASFILGFDKESSKTADKMIACIQESGICMAMVGTLHALPNTQLAEKLQRQGRLFEEGTTIRDKSTEIDQMSNGLNFITDRPRIDILKDYKKIITQLYAPKNYYQRLTYMGTNLKKENKYKANRREFKKVIIAFSRLVSIEGFKKDTGWLFWKLLFTLLVKNPKALELTLGMASMYIHFSKHSKFIIDLVEKKIEFLEKYGENEYIRIMKNKAQTA
jgi:radical SAM superfamily enzyme YgiQ (UPF0313 family)